LGLAFFGLTSDYFEVMYNEIFYLMHYLNFSYQDALNLPIFKRQWFLKRYIKEITPKEKNNTPPPPSAHSQAATHNFSKRRI
jgi:hypothetical protein